MYVVWYRSINDRLKVWVVKDAESEEEAESKIRLLMAGTSDEVGYPCRVEKLDFDGGIAPAYLQDND